MARLLSFSELSIYMLRSGDSWTGTASLLDGLRVYYDTWPGTMATNCMALWFVIYSITFLPRVHIVWRRFASDLLCPPAEPLALSPERGTRLKCLLMSFNLQGFSLGMYFKPWDERGAVCHCSLSMSCALVSSYKPWYRAISIHACTMELIHVHVWGCVRVRPYPPFPLTLC